MKRSAGYEVLFHRHPNNPILTAAHWPYPVHAVFNAAATLLPDRTTLLLCRVEDRRGHSHLCAARSANGIDGWEIDPQPTLLPSPTDHPEELWGIEDPRITFVEELGKYAIAYTAFGRSGPGVALALTSDFRTFGAARRRQVQPEGQGCRPPSAPDRRQLRADSPSGDRVRRAHLDIALARSHQLGHPPSAAPRPQGGVVGREQDRALAPPHRDPRRVARPLPRGPPHGRRGPLSTRRRPLRTGALRALHRTWGIVDLRGQRSLYECQGAVGNVVFPCGYTLDAAGDTIKLYYGAADTTIALATGSIRQLLAWVLRNNEV